MARRKADGAAFERELRKAIQPRYFIKRLPTLNTGFAGIRQPADFIVVGKRFNYIEAKETTGQRMSIKSIQQYDKMIEFVEEREKYSHKENKEYWLVVNFVLEGVIKVLTVNEALSLAENRKTLRFDSAIGKTFTAVRELGGIDF